MPMKGRYEIVDNNHPTWKGMRYTKLEHAQREIEQAVGEPGRFTIRDRQTTPKQRRV